jgi:hypothetical protein
MVAGNLDAELHNGQGETSYEADHEKGGSFGIGSSWRVLDHDGRCIGDRANKCPVAG